MARSFTVVDLVQLPTLDAGSAQALGAEVINTANKAKKEEPLPESVAEALDELSHAREALRKAAAKRLVTPDDPQRARMADQAIDAAWSGLSDWLTGWSKMSGLPEAKIAQGLLAKLFPDGLKFVLYAYKLQWSESDARLLVIKNEKLDAEFKQLGGEKILKLLQAAHKEYGDAIGITGAQAEETGTIRETLDVFVDALRMYVVRVTASVSKKNKKSAARAEALLAPIATWETPGGGGKSGSDDGGAPPPAGGGEAPTPPGDASKPAGEEPKPA